MKTLLITLAAITSFLLHGTEPKRFTIGEKTWIFTGETKAGEASYIPAGEDPKGWSEAIIFYHIPAEDLSLPKYYETFINLLNERSNNLFQSDVVKSDKNSILFAWWTDPLREEKQYGLVKISKVSSGLIFFRYTATGEKDQKKIDEWEKILSNSELQMVPLDVQITLPWGIEEREWKKIHENTSYYEYIPENEPIDEWQEKVTIHIWSTLPLPLSDFYTLLIEDLKEHFGPAVQNRLITLNSQELFFEWWENEGPNPRHEWYRIQIIGPELATVVRYTAKKQEISEDERQKWQTILQSVRFKPEYRYKIIQKDEPLLDVRSQER